MKLEKIVLFYIIFFFSDIKASYAKNKFIEDENSLQLKRDLQQTESINTSKIYNITVTRFSINNQNELYFIVSSEPRIENSQDNITFSIYFQINRYDKLDGSWYYRNYNCFFDFYNPGMYVTPLDFNITGLTIINIYDAVEEYREHNNIYYINYPKHYLIINPPNQPYLSNQTLKGKYDYYINITDFYIENDQFQLIIDFIPNAPENIILFSPLLIEIYNKSSGNMTERIFNLELNIYNATNIPNIFSLNLDILNINGYTEISMLYAIVENNVNDYMIRVEFPYLKKIIFYEINITDFYINNNDLVFMIDYFPKTIGNISLLLSLEYYSYNESMGFITYKYINETININNISDIYTVNLINLNINWHTEIRIWNAFVENKNKEAYFFIYYPNKSLVYNISLVTPTELPSNNYYINISDFYLNNSEIVFNIFFEPYTSESIDLIITLYIHSYNNSFRNFTYQNVNITFILNSYSNQYQSILEVVNLTEYFEITISNAFILTNKSIDKYNIYYPTKILIYETVITNTSSPIRPINTQTNEPTDNPNNGNDDNNNNNNNNNNAGNGGNTNNDNDEGDTETTPSTSVTKNSSSSVSLGMIIGIIVGILVAIGIIVVVIIFIRKRRKKLKQEKVKLVKDIPTIGSEDKIITTSGNINLNVPEAKMRKFHFQTQSQFKTDVSIDEDKDLSDLRKLYFEKINRNDLLDDPSIYFLYGGNILENKGLVKERFKNNEELNILVVDDEEKIYKLQIN